MVVLPTIPDGTLTPPTLVRDVAVVDCAAVFGVDVVVLFE